MALPTSGSLSFSAIANELNISLENVSLRSMSNSAGFSTPDSVSEFYGYINEDVTLYFVVRNKVAKSGTFDIVSDGVRVITDGMAYELYEKPDSNNTSTDDYTLVDFSDGDGLRTYSNGRWLTSITVTFDQSGNPIIDVDQPKNATRDLSFYEELISRYLLS